MATANNRLRRPVTVILTDTPKWRAEFRRQAWQRLKRQFRAVVKRLKDV